VVEVRKTDEFDRWIENLQDLRARAKILKARER
jgi:putative component of toxin-antitoxin plasmid stabilization module